MKRVTIYDVLSTTDKLAGCIYLYETVSTYLKIYVRHVSTNHSQELCEQCAKLKISLLAVSV